MKLELGDLTPLRRVLEELVEWEAKVRQRPLPEADPVVHALGTVRTSLERAIDDARNIELELTSEQYAQLAGLSIDAVHKRWQRGQLPQARIRGGKVRDGKRRGGKLVVPVKEIARVA
jgi:hypothetical protein